MPETASFIRYTYLALRTAAGAYLLICLLVYLLQEHLVYFPTQSFISTPEQQGLRYRLVRIPTANGVELSGWVLEAPRPRGYALYCHGNGGNISHRLEPARLLLRAGLTVLLFDYRGYGESPGKPTEQGTYEDAEAAWNFALRELNFDPAKTVLWGESLGGGVASWLATRQEAGAVVLQSTFISLAAMARERYPVLPTPLLLRIRYPNRANLPRIEEPILVIHSPQDEVVPYHHGRELYAAIQGPKQMLTISGGHNSGLMDSREVVEPALARFLDQYIGPDELGYEARSASASVP